MDGTSPMTQGVSTLRVAARREEAEDVVVLDLAAPDGSPLPPFEAGAHIDLHLPGGFIRQYSLCNAPSERNRYQIAVLREPASRGGSVALHEQVGADDILTVGGPRNQFPLVADAPAILLAGGIGITPLMAMSEQLATDGTDFALHYCSRDPARTVFAKRLAAAPFADRVRLHHSTQQRLDLADALAEATPETHLYVCGPQRFIEAARDTAFALGWPDDQVHFEHFAAGAVVPEAGDEPFEVEIASTGAVLPVPVGSTVLQVLAEHGIAVTSSCEQGICGSCLTSVQDGEPDHRDHFLSDTEKAANNQFLPCCSRALGPRLVLDL